MTFDRPRRRRGKRQGVFVKTVLLEEPERVLIREALDAGAPGPGEARVKVLRVGVCGTDLHAYRGRQAFVRYPVVPGHELAVEIEALGPAVGEEVDRPGSASLHVGDRCAVVPYLADGVCQACRAGRSNCCSSLRVLGVHVDGGMCDRLVLPASSLMPANDVPIDTLALIEMLAVGAHASGRARLDERARVLVVGAGPIGLSTLAFASRVAGSTWVYDVDERRLALAEALGLARGVRPSAPSSGLVDPLKPLVEGLREALDGDLPEVVIDATGSAASMERSPALVAPGGRVVFVGHTPGRLSFANPSIHGKELELVASRAAGPQDFDAVFAAVRTGEVDPRPWVTTRVDPEGFVQSIDGWTRPGSDVVKALIDWSPSSGRPAQGAGAGLA